MLYVICAGPMSEPIIYELYKNNPHNCYIDFGSSIDRYIHKKQTRSYENPKSKNAQKNCAMPNPKITDFDISIVLTPSKNTDNLKLQIAAIKNQTLKPKEILLYTDDVKLVDYIKKDFNEIKIYPKNNLNKFQFALENVLSKYVCFIDENLVPGTSWLANCHRNILKVSGIYGAEGVLILENKQIFFGVNNEIRQTKEVDFVQKSIFLEKELLKSYNENSNDDIYLSSTLKKILGIKTFVPPHPTRHHDMWGFLPECTKEFDVEKQTNSFMVSKNNISNNFICEQFKNNYPFLYRTNSSYVKKMFRGRKFVEIITKFVPLKKFRHFVRGKLKELFYK